LRTGDHHGKIIIWIVDNSILFTESDNDEEKDKDEGEDDDEDVSTRRMRRSGG